MAFKMNPKSPCLKSTGHYATPQAIKPAVTSPTKQTASQKKNLPEVIVKAIAAKSPAKQKQETYEERQARKAKEKKKEAARLAGVKAKREARNAADANKPKPTQQTKLQALKARITSDLTSTKAEKPRSQT